MPEFYMNILADDRDYFLQRREDDRAETRIEPLHETLGKKLFTKPGESKALSIWKT
jgi:hypothetical protein